MDTANITDSIMSIERTFGIMSEIGESAHSLVQNTTPDFWYDDWSFIAVFSALATVSAVISIVRDTRQSRIAESCHRLLFSDIIRHLYRNKVCVSAMKLKYLMASNEGKTYCYPSDEHYLKLRLLPEDLHLEKYYRHKKTFDMLHKLYLLMRNYNVEIDTALEHIKANEIPFKTKMRDFETLDFKSGYITSKLLEVMQVLWTKEDMEKFAWSIVLDAHQANIKDNAIPTESCYAQLLEEVSAKESSSDWYFTRILSDNHIAFKNNLSTDILIECGLNSKGQEKIHIIEM